MNCELRTLMQKCGVRQWEVAEAVGVSEFRFSRLMRHELPESMKTAALEAVKRISEERKAGENGKIEN